MSDTEAVRVIGGLRLAGVLAAVLLVATGAQSAEVEPIRVYEADTAGLAHERLSRVDAALASRPQRIDLLAERLRVVYFLAIESSDWLAPAFAAAETLATRATTWPVAATAEAYRGALITLEAKHAFWPPRKLARLNEGFAVMGRVVERLPGHVEARYLRLMSGYWLPALLGKADYVREDFAALAALLPAGPGDLPADLWANTADFVLTHAPHLPDAARGELQYALSRVEARLPERQP